ncbi:MAG: 16S rRNA (uracil(1498)-N(3))-methyltransferase [Lentisphaeria bacterium]|nr:16S rRNA (uracil(1498)-N(3))-methyltransferase [Lentisphaeria bacterium]
MHRVFCAEIPPVGEIAGIESREKEHLFKVFRAACGEEVELLDGHGKIARGTVESGKVIRIDTVKVFPEPELKLHLCCALPRKQKLDQMLKQAAELGAWSIRPLRCIRSVAEGGPKERWDLLLREACKQSGNPFMPELFPEEKLPAALERLEKAQIQSYYGDVVPDGQTPAGIGRDRALLIGPEGGFAPEEIELMKAKGALPFNFAPYILRLETAAICGLTALRMLGMLLLTAAVIFTAGCGEESIEKNPLMIKGAKMLEKGDFESSRRYFRQVVAVHPERPEPYLALAKLCDEYLDDPLEALYCYRMYLQFTPESSPDRQSIENIVARLKQRTGEQFGGGKKDADAEKIAYLQERVRLRERKIVQQQQIINRLHNELMAEKQKHNRRNRR